jgi:hypothetical protein
MHPKRQAALLSTAQARFDLRTVHAASRFEDTSAEKANVTDV